MRMWPTEARVERAAVRYKTMAINPYAEGCDDRRRFDWRRRLRRGHRKQGQPDPTCLYSPKQVDLASANSPVRLP